MQSILRAAVTGKTLPSRFGVRSDGATTRSLVAVATSSQPATTAVCLSSHGQEAVGRLKDALEQYRVKNYAMETPRRFKQEIAVACCATTGRSNDDRAIAVEGIENMCRNIGVFGDRVTHD